MSEPVRAALRFTHLKLAGFKSFADPVDLEIREGVSGIVGPNGCGKSNLVDALRWVMAEGSSRNMRGGEMDDVIFSGTSLRPAREMAEVVLVLDNEARAAPEGYNDSDQIEISRRIERESGSVYRINDREVRARDVAVFFADILGGAHSSALVGQGRIERLISSPPRERRRILEEAAGIMGLQARRHEAELRLQAAESNLTRLDDSLAVSRGRLGQLRKQSRQAARWNKLSHEISRLETAAVVVRLMAAKSEQEGAAAKAAEKRSEEEHLNTALVLAQTREQKSETGLPAMRDKARQAEAAYARLEQEADTLEKEAQGLAARRSELEAAIRQAGEDKRKSEHFLKDSEASLALLDAEQTRLEAEEAAEKGSAGQAAARLREAQQAAAEAEEAARTAAEAVQTRAMTQASLEKQQEAASASAAEAEAAIAVKSGALAEIDSGTAGKRLERAEEAAALAEKARTLAAEKLHAAEAAASEAQARANDAAAKAEAAAQRVLALESERDSLLAFAPGGGRGQMLIDALEVSGEYELALAAALADSLIAPIEGKSPAFWQKLSGAGELAPLPEGAAPLDTFISAPAFLLPRLKMTGLVDEKQADILQKRLRPGQRLVSLAGGLWRWDGWRTEPELAGGVLERISKWRQFSDLTASLAEAQKDCEQAEKAQEKALAAAGKTRLSESQIRAAHQTASAAHETAQLELAAALRDASQFLADRAALEEALRRLKQDSAAAAAAGEAAAQDLQRLAAAGGLGAKAAAERARADKAHTALAGVRAAHEGFAGRGAARTARLTALAEEKKNWQRRAEEMGAHLDSLVLRESEAREQLRLLAARPAELTKRRAEVEKLQQAAGKARQASAGQLGELEANHHKLVRATREAAAALAELREQRVRDETLSESAAGKVSELTGQLERISGRSVEDAVEWADLGDGAAAELDTILARITRMENERTRLGQPNLRAGEEAEKIEADIGALASEAEDLQGAIRRLRQGITDLDRKARARLRLAYDEMAAHFTRLFRVLFGGGEAKLEMEGEDILDAGLEIIARPPGKKAQRISLLSGGEKTLTALALLFAAMEGWAVPICVLDEVDAPLDEVNVGRFCTLVEEVSARLGTQFLVVTHNAVTLSRMARLFGVTMEEKGVSKIVAVELAEAEKLREKAA